MRVIVFGGAGDMGSQCVEDLAGHPDVSHVTIADRDFDRAKRLADSLRDQSAAVLPLMVDANDHGALVDAANGHDVAASALGPFFRFETKLVRAAIEAGVDYASICDDWSAASDVIKAHDGDAKKNGRTVITGLGASPGLTNVGVQYLATQMSHVREVDINVYQPLDAGGGEAVLRHMLFIMTGDVATWRSRRAQMIPACSEERTVEFPEFGEIKVWNMGHAEPVTLPMHFGDLENVNFFMGYGRGATAFVWPAQRGLFRSRRVTEGVVRIAARLQASDAKNGKAPGLGAVRLDVRGDKDGVPVERMVCGVGEMRATTGHSLSVGVLMLGRKQLLNNDGGVLAPEACLEAGPFLAEMRRFGFTAYEDLAMQTPLQID